MRAEPIIKYEDCLAEGKAMRLNTETFWTVDLLDVEVNGLRDKSRPGDGTWSQNGTLNLAYPIGGHLTG